MISEQVAPCAPESAAPLPQAVLSTAPSVLGRVRDADSNLAIWQRRAVIDWSPLLAGEPADIRFDTERAALADRFAQALARNGFAAPHLHRALTDDVSLLAGLFCSALGIERLELRLEVVTSDSCRKFHADYVVARLITTYVGPGTQWLESADAARLREGGEPRRINRMAAGDVGIFKGRLASEHPAIHRSPPIATSPGPRLLLVLNRTERP
ncbi:DUF1826 domain-containing protein [Erythrobacter sp. HL-111]|uniref:DUF1826 domain-containing protein n=1 Tax=Erythrobacter sp. HL-111 TaxID=1798193 RepID=UPI0006DAA326|nr:DUF1826 domain-containing protein [Erythrobacter sp. HL-111]KPP93195.1 MAG: Protein of unknown function (DUF1826) [Erythrobacteraceae bacterium HL-111]SDR92853.1 Protein of unknown function [Erythrobacter sp. HL-111]